MPPKSVTFTVCDEGNIIFSNVMQPPNIQLADIPSEKSKFDKSMKVIYLHPSNNLLQLFILLLHTNLTMFSVSLKS